MDNKTALDIVQQNPGNNSHELEVLLLFLGALKYQEMHTSKGAGEKDGKVTDTVAEMEDDVFMTESVSTEHEHEHRQPLANPITPNVQPLYEGQLISSCIYVSLCVCSEA